MNFTLDPVHIEATFSCVHEQGIPFILQRVKDIASSIVNDNHFKPQTLT